MTADDSSPAPAPSGGRSARVGYWVTGALLVSTVPWPLGSGSTRLAFGLPLWVSLSLAMTSLYCVAVYVALGRAFADSEPADGPANESGQRPPRGPDTVEHHPKGR